MKDLIEASARNLAAWHEWQLRAHGLECAWTDSLWSCAQAGPTIFLDAITVSSASGADEASQLAEIQRLVSARHDGDFTLRDCWMALDLTDRGFEPEASEPWYSRQTSPPPTRYTPPELRIDRVTEADGLEAFEDAAIEAFEMTTSTRSRPWHAAASLDHPQGRYLAGTVDGRIVSVSIAYVSDGVVGVYGVATLPEYRRRGYGAALTWAATLAEPDLPAVLQPSEVAVPLYRSMGYAEIGQFRQWRRKEPSR